MDKGVQRFALYCGVSFPVVFFTGYLITGLFPPPSPHETLQTTMNHYTAHADQTRFGLFLMIASAPLQAPLAALIGIHMRRIEGKHSVLAFTQMILAGVAVMAVLLPTMDMINLVFRAEDTDVHTLQIFHDQAWLLFVGMWSAATMQNICIALCILRDKRETPIMARWYGYVNLWVGTLFIPGGLIYWFKSGAFAWNGAFAFWLPASVFGGWFIVSFVELRRVIAAQPDEELVAA